MYTLSAAYRVITFGFLLLLTGSCSKPYDGVSDYDRAQMKQKEGIDAIIAQGGKAEPKNHGLGDGWAIHLPGQTITDETINTLKQVEKIAELNLSKSTVTDAQIMAMCDQKLFSSLVALNVSNTGVTDAVLDKLSEVQFLAQINVTGSKITAAGLQRFRDARKNNPRIPDVTKNPKIIGP
jgi:hypothetical protein